MSDEDLSTKNQRWIIRVQFDTRCTIQKLVPHVDEDRPGELFVRQGRQWRLIGRIQSEDKGTGRVTAVDE
jgi:hypothetical protein